MRPAESDRSPGWRAAKFSGHVELASVSKLYGTTVAVDRISLDIAAGSYCCLVGPSGCGKTSTLRMIAGHETTSDGDILIDDQVITDAPPAKRGTAMMFQDYALFPHLTVLDNVAFGLRARGISRPDREIEAMRLLALVGLEGFRDRRPAQLSGGQRQRVALSRALIVKPRVLLLDEPLSALDPFLRARMRGELKRLQIELGMTFVHVTHAQDEAMALSDLLVVMDSGRVVQSGPPAQVFNRPASRFVAELIGGHNVADVTVVERQGQDTRVRLLDGATTLTGRASEADAQPGESCTMTVRVDAIGFDQPGQNAVAGRARVVEYLGALVRIDLDVPGFDRFGVLIPERAFQQRPVRVGDAVTARWASEATHLMPAPD